MADNPDQIAGDVQILPMRRSPAARLHRDGQGGYVSQDGAITVRPAYIPTLSGRPSRPSYWSINDTTAGTRAERPTLTAARAYVALILDKRRRTR
jgi:hypothetical protein